MPNLKIIPNHQISEVLLKLPESSPSQEFDQTHFCKHFDKLDISHLLHIYLN
jgi:hypothetical protein